MQRAPQWQSEGRLVRITAAAVTLEGNLSLPAGVRAVVLFAHGSGSSRHSSRIGTWRGCSTRRGSRPC